MKDEFDNEGMSLSEWDRSRQKLWDESNDGGIRGRRWIGTEDYASWLKFRRMCAELPLLNRFREQSNG